MQAFSLEKFVRILLLIGRSIGGGNNNPLFVCIDCRRN